MNDHRLELVVEVRGIFHLRCPECGKEVVASNDPPLYRVMRDEHGKRLAGDFYARHHWGRGGISFDPTKSPDIQQ